MLEDYADRLKSLADAGIPQLREARQQLQRVYGEYLAADPWTDKLLKERQREGWPAFVEYVLKTTEPVQGSDWPDFYVNANTSGDKLPPLLVCLHTWSGDSAQSKPRNEMRDFAKSEGWAFLHPNFGGPNFDAEACASESATSEIFDAVRELVITKQVDPERLYLVGFSGGGHMALHLAHRQNPKTFFEGMSTKLQKKPSIWAAVAADAPIVDLAAWASAEEINLRLGLKASKAKRKIGTDRYSNLVHNVCGGRLTLESVEKIKDEMEDGEGKLDPNDPVAKQYLQRSPLYHLGDPRNASHLRGLRIWLSAGLLDGIGSPVHPRHAVKAYRSLATLNGYSEEKELEDFWEPTRIRWHQEDDWITFNADPVILHLHGEGHVYQTKLIAKWLGSGFKVPPEIYGGALVAQKSRRRAVMD